MLSKSDKAVIDKAIKDAERSARAELVCVVAPASDAYLSYVFLYGFLAGSLIDLGLWFENRLMQYPVLLTVQLGAICLVSMFPWLRHACMRCVPRRMRHRRASHRAFEEYLIVTRHVSADTPVVLLYVSLAERYAHILSSRTVREKIPDVMWNDVIGELTKTLPTLGVRDACVTAIRLAAALLTTHFPRNL